MAGVGAERTGRPPPGNYRLRFGAAWLRAEAAAVFEARPVPSRRTFGADRAALVPVLGPFAMPSTPFRVAVPCDRVSYQKRFCQKNLALPHIPREGRLEIVELGKRLRRRRQDLGQTLATVAAAAGVSVPYVANLERGRGNPTIEVLHKIAVALDVPLATLMDEEAHGSEGGVVELHRSLVDFSRTERFREEVERLAKLQRVPVDEMRSRVLAGMASAPRRSTSEPTKEDWSRLLDTYILILRR